MDKKVDIAFRIPIDNSTALKMVEYNSKTEELAVTYVQGERYVYQSPPVSEMFKFIAMAYEIDSWGTAWNRWARSQDLQRKQTNVKKIRTALGDFATLSEIAAAEDELEKAKEQLLRSQQDTVRRYFYG